MKTIEFEALEFNAERPLGAQLAAARAMGCPYKILQSKTGLSREKIRKLVSEEFFGPRAAFEHAVGEAMMALCGSLWTFGEVTLVVDGRALASVSIDWQSAEAKTVYLDKP